jgi:hypothetical protein
LVPGEGDTLACGRVGGGRGVPNSDEGTDIVVLYVYMYFVHYNIVIHKNILEQQKILVFFTFPFSREVVVTVEYPVAENPFLGGYRNKVCKS